MPLPKENTIIQKKEVLSTALLILKIYALSLLIVNS